jgi:2-dehydro-3-deoxygluconokinase
MKPTVCFGEIMARFSPRDHLRIAQAMPGAMEVTFAGAEANVAVAVARLGGRAEFVTALPFNPVADAAVAALRTAGVGVDQIVRSDAGRCGIYFVETGASQRGGLVVYDRDGSAFSLAGATDYPWPEIFANAGWFHTSGIAAGISRAAAEAAREAVCAARRTGLTVSCDLNFRRKLWRWEPGVAPESLARHTLATILPEVDLLIGNPHDLADTLEVDFEAAPADRLEAHIALAARVGARWPQLHMIAMTLRQNHSASHNQWGALLFRPSDGAVFIAPQKGGHYAPYEITPIVDRVGSGDVFAGALIYALQTMDLQEPQRALSFATAASCLAHSIQGDFFHGTRAEVEGIVNGGDMGHISR